MVGSDPREDFRHARRHCMLARAWRQLTARPGHTRPQDLGDAAALAWRSPRLEPVPLDAIVGTVDATADFDADFRPATDRIGARWERVARAYRQGTPLPPITLLERPDGYYVVDGRHRVSVARALGQTDIDAWTSPAEPGRTTPPTIHQGPPLMPSLPRRLRDALTTALRPRHDKTRVHFHAGEHGRPYVCEDPRCSSPRLTPTDP